MNDPRQALRLQLLDWIESCPRTYDETIGAWRTTCPRLSVWEDANIDGLIDLAGPIVRLTNKGRAALDAQQREDSDSR